MELRTLSKLARPYRLRLVVAGILTLAASIVTLTIPWLAGHLAGGLFAAPITNPANLLALLFLALTAVACLSFLVSLVSGDTAARMLSDLRLQIYRHLQSLPVGFHEQQRRGDMLALMTFEISRLTQFLSGTVVSALPLAVTILGAVVVMFRIDPVLTLIVPILVPAFFLILKLIGRQLRGLAQKLQQAEADLVALAERNLAMMPAIKAYTREDAEADTYGDRIGRTLQLRLTQNQIYAALQPAVSLAASVVLLLLLVYAGARLQEGRMNASELFSYLLYAALLTRPVGALADFYGQTQSALGTLARLQSILNEPMEPGYAEKAALPSVTGAIAFCNVSFGYPGRSKILQDVNFEIEPGEIVAITGLNGAGKTTLIHLLLRFHDPDKGTIAIDGQDISRLNVRDLRKLIGLVPQRPFLFNGTIHENIAFGLEHSTQSQVLEAVRLAQAADFVAGLPSGIETLIGDEGVRLSGGQRQRIALARAFLKDPPILILDEPTAMFDTAGEMALIRSIPGKLRGRTILIISHRPSTLALADRVLEVRQTCVTEVKPERASSGLSGTGPLGLSR